MHHLWLTDLGMDDDGDDDPVPLPNVNAAILKKVTKGHANTKYHLCTTTEQNCVFFYPGSAAS